MGLFSSSILCLILSSSLAVFISVSIHWRKLYLHLLNSEIQLDKISDIGHELGAQLHIQILSSGQIHITVGCFKLENI